MSDKNIICMRKLSIIFFLLLTQVALCQPLYEHRGVQYATHGTDFWFSMPRTRGASSEGHACLYIIAEHNCTVTISNDVLDFVLTKQITNCHEINSRLDTLNFIELPKNIIYCIDTLSERLPLESQPALGPQPRGFHITSTDTICAYLFSFAMGTIDVTNLLPTEMLRDEYMIQVLPDFGPPVPENPVGQKMGWFQVVATEDSTVVDIEMGDWDFMQRPKDTTITVVLDRGMMFFTSVGSWCIKYPHCCPFALNPEECIVPVDGTFAYRFPVDPTIDADVLRFVDLSGTRIKARDNKRIAVFQGNQQASVIFLGTADYLFEQALPTRFAGKEFLIPNLRESVEDYIQFTGLEDGTTFTITDPASTPMATHTASIDARQTYRFIMDTNEGPFYITADHPILVSVYTCGQDVNDRNLMHMGRGDPATLVVVPVEWWHNGPVNGSPVYWIDNNRNGWSYYHNTHIFTRTADVRGMYYDRRLIDTLFHPIPGTPYSHALILYNSPLSTRTVHRIENRRGGAFWVVADAEKDAEHALYSYSHLQPGTNYLELNGVPADMIPYDSIWCMYDPIQFHGWVERPADSIIWDFGDGNEERYRYEDGQWVTHTFADTGRFEVKRIIQYMDEALDTNWGYVGCKSAFTRPSDTMYAHIWIHNHYDSAFAVTVCEGPFTFRGHVLETTDTHYVTTYWTASGCDTLWQIDLVTCPHCSFYSDTISDEQLPWFFNGISFSSETRHYPIHIDIGDECDSVIDYYLIVIPHWGDPPLDTIFVLGPNVVTPNSDIEVNRTFRLFCSKDIEVAEVYIFDRMGRRLAHFDGLTEEWDCTYNGIPCPQAAYAYYVRYIDGSNRNWKTASGTFTIIR